MTDQNIGPLLHHQQTLNEGRFLLQKSKSTGEYCYPPRVVSPFNGEDDLEWVEASGLGTVYAVTTVSRRPEKGGNYNISIVELEEGPRLMTRVIDADPESITIGAPVKMVVEVPDFGALAGSDQKTPLFKLV